MENCSKCGQLCDDFSELFQCGWCLKCNRGDIVWAVRQKFERSVDKLSKTEIYRHNFIDLDSFKHLKSILRKQWVCSKCGVGTNSQKDLKRAIQDCPGGAYLQKAMMEAKEQIQEANWQEAQEQLKNIRRYK